jgi:predicted nucleotidyltransferase
MATEVILDQAPTRDEVLSRLRACLPRILAGRPVLSAYLYGSVAEGYALPGSDVDVALVLLPDHGLSPYQRMLEDRCGLSHVDVRSINDAPLVAQGTVVTEGVLLYERDEEARADYEVLTRKRYFDFLPVARMMQDAYFEHMGTDLRRRGLLHDG